MGLESQIIKNKYTKIIHHFEYLLYIYMVTLYKLHFIIILENDILYGKGQRETNELEVHCEN